MPHTSSETVVTSRFLRAGRRWMGILAVGAALLSAGCGPAEEEEVDLDPEDGANYEALCDEKDNDGDGVVDDGCALRVGFEQVGEPRTVGRTDGSFYGSACSDALHEIAFSFMSDYFRDGSLYGVDYPPGRLKHVESSCLRAELTYAQPRAVPQVQFPTRAPKVSKGDKFLKRRFTCGRRSFLSGLAGVYRDNSFVKMQAICSQLVLEPAADDSDAAYRVRVEEAVENSSCFDTEHHPDGTCEPLMACPEGTFANSVGLSAANMNHDKIDGSAVGLTMNCVRPSSLVIRDELGRQQLEPIAR